VIGNYDLKVLRFPRKSEKWRKKKRPEKWFAFKWAYEQLSRESRDYLASLPEQKRWKTEGRDILLVHGSPASVDEHLYVDTPEKRLKELSELAEADVVVCGHSHQSFVMEAAGSIFINTGSVGRPDDGDPRAAYAILEMDGSSLSVLHKRVAYDVEAAVLEMRRHKLPSAFEEMIRQGRKLDWILGSGSR
jgi:predicted phosphodiesterase